MDFCLFFFFSKWIRKQIGVRVAVKVKIAYLELLTHVIPLQYSVATNLYIILLLLRGIMLDINIYQVIFLFLMIYIVNYSCIVLFLVLSTIFVIKYFVYFSTFYYGLSHVSIRISICLYYLAEWFAGSFSNYFI